MGKSALSAAAELTTGSKALGVARTAASIGPQDARSASLLSQAERPMPSFCAARKYLPFSSCVTRTWICSVAGFWMGGLPGFRLVGMGILCLHK